MAKGPSLPAIDPGTVAHALTAFVNANIMAHGRRIQPDDEFEMMGIDSMALLKVLLFVEAEFGFWPPDEDLVAENLRSPRARAHYLCRRRSVS
jgi:acyl carrier protein